MDAPRYTRAELCLIHLATVLAVTEGRGEAAGLARAEVAFVLPHLRDPSPDLNWLVDALRTALREDTGSAWWRLQLAIADLSARRAAAVFDPVWRAGVPA